MSGTPYFLSALGYRLYSLMKNLSLHLLLYSIKIVDSFHYVGSCITNDNNEAAEIQRRLKLANNAYYSISSVMKSRDVHKGMKIRL
jgi:hypothetical protein